MSKTGLFETLIEILSSAMVGKVLSDLDTKLKDYATSFAQRIVRRIMLMVAGFTITLIGIIFLFVASALYLNEFLKSAWMGWGVVGLAVLVVGLITYAASRR